MKRIISYLFALFFCLSLNAQNFNVKFNIKGITSSEAYVTVFGDKDATHVDYTANKEYNTVKVENGLINVTGTTKEYAVLRISFMGDKQFLKMVGRGYIPVKSASLWFIVGPNTNMTIEGDLTNKDYIDIYPSSDPENALFAKLNREMMPLLNKSVNLAVKFQLDKSLTEEQKKDIDRESEEIDVAVAKIRESFVSQKPSCIASLWLMEDMLIRSQIETATLEPLLNKVDAKYHNNYFYTSVKSRVDGAKKAGVGSICPSIKGKDQNDADFDIKQLRGKYVIIDFWGTWCGACLAGMPAMKEFRDSHKEKVEIVGVANDKNVVAWKKCIATKGMNWPNIMQGKDENDFVAKFNVQGFPTKILVSPEGKILYRASGESDEFYKILETLIK